MTYSSQHHGERGAISGLMVVVIALAFLAVGLGSFGIWAFVEYNDAKSDVEGKIALAVADAKQAQSEADEEKFTKRDNALTKSFRAPDDYCSLSFLYPKVWSAYESEEVTNGGDYKAFLHPDVIPPINATQQLALRVTIEQKDYDSVVNDYSNLVKKGDLKQSTTAAEGKQGTRLTGNFNKNIRGDAVIYRCRDKTITVRTDADTFKDSFEAPVRTISFKD